MKQLTMQVCNDMNRVSIDWHSQPIASHSAKNAKAKAVGGGYEQRA